MTDTDKIQDLIENIKGGQTKTVNLLSILSIIMDSLGSHEGNLPEIERDVSYFKFLATESHLKRIHAIIHDDFQRHPSNLALIAITRHIFEMRVWVRLIDQNLDGPWLYYGNLVKEKIKYWKTHRDYLEEEIRFLEGIGERESEMNLRTKILLNESTNEDKIVGIIRDNRDQVEEMIDQQLAVRFTIYGGDARSNGFSYAANHIEEKMLPNIVKNIDILVTKYDKFEKKFPQVYALVNKNWNWFEMSKKVGLVAEYGLIYSAGSSILHAGPGSTTTSEIRLTDSEQILMLRFFEISQTEILKLARENIEDHLSVSVVGDE